MSYEFLKEKKPSVSRFAVLSDCHVPLPIHKKYLTLALDAFNEIGGIDGLLMTGDIIYQDGATLVRERYDPVMELLHEKMPNTPFVYTLGNHETPLISEALLTPELLKEACDLFEEKVKQPVRYHTVIAGYHFITDITVKSPDLVWIEEQLRTALSDDPQKPIFLMLHDCFETLLTHTIRYSHAWREELHRMLKRYPQIVVLAGHLHMVAQSPDMVVQDGFSVVQVPGLGETGLILGDGLFGNFEKPIWPQALLMEVEGTTVTFRKLNLKDATEIGRPIVIDVRGVASGIEPYAFSNKAASHAPYFPEGAQITAQRVAEGTEVSFPTAANQAVNAYSQDDFVIAYRVEGFDAKGTCVVSELAVSEFYRADKPNEMKEQFRVLLKHSDEIRLASVGVTPISPFRRDGKSENAVLR